MTPLLRPHHDLTKRILLGFMFTALASCSEYLEVRFLNDSGREIK